jgi:hypothetical protein
VRQQSSQIVFMNYLAFYFNIPLHRAVLWAWDTVLGSKVRHSCYKMAPRSARCEGVPGIGQRLLDSSGWTCDMDEKFLSFRRVSLPGSFVRPDGLLHSTEPRFIMISFLFIIHMQQNATVTTSTVTTTATVSYKN